MADQLLRLRINNRHLGSCWRVDDGAMSQISNIRCPSFTVDVLERVSLWCCGLFAVDQRASGSRLSSVNGLMTRDRTEAGVAQVGWASGEVGHCVLGPT